jgi:glycosyltransferase involved in cell wall biosynthesis
MVVQEKASLDPSVNCFEPPLDLNARVRRVSRRRFLRTTHTSLSSRPRAAGYFTDDRSQHGGDALRQALPADVLHMHWIAGLIDYRIFFRALPSDLPVVWTLHDMNPMTGGCHHAGSCGGFRQSCGTCPELNSSIPRDLSAAIWRRKNEAYGRLGANRTRIVTPSRWLANLARASSLMSGFQIETIPYGLDTNTFQPRERLAARELFGIPRKAKALLFVAQWLDDRYKGMPTLLAAIERLRSIPEVCLLVLGRGEDVKKCGIRSIFLGSIGDDERMSYAYSAADLFLLPSVADNFPNTALESLSCGLPVIGSAIGGIPEMVRDGYTGLLVPPNDAQALANAAALLLENPDRLKGMSANCRRVAVQEYTLDLQAQRYLEIYGGMLSARRRSFDSQRRPDGELIAQHYPS